MLFCLAWVALQSLIVPRIDNLRPRLESYLTQSLGAPVRIGAIAAQSNALAPSFELSDVRLQDSAGRDALILKKIFVVLSPRSILQLGFEQLIIEQPELDVRRDAKGQIFIAGFPLSSTAFPSADLSADNDSTNWFFSQREFAIRSGSVRWTDERRGAAPLTLSQVDVVLRNSGRSHQMRIDATPQASWGNRFSLMGDFRAALLADAGQWKQWQGELYTDFSRVDVSQLKRYADLGINVARGTGAMRLWAQLDQGQFTQATADLALENVDVQLAPHVKALVMPKISGRIAGQRLAGGVRVSTQNLAFQTQDGILWPGGNASYLQTGADNPQAQAYGEFKADKLDLAALAQVADRLPIGTRTHAQIRSFAPQGLVESVQASWKGQLDAPLSYAAKGRVVGLAVAAKVAPTIDQQSHPGVRGATVDFDLTDKSGSAVLAISQGAVTLPDVFEDPVMLFDSLSTRAKWSFEGAKIDVQLEALKFANADAQGEAKGQWRTADPSKSAAKSRFPGVIDLQGVLTRGDGARVHRYLPLGIGKSAREYVRNAVLQGTISSAQFKIKGDLFDMPFTDPQKGDFRISAQVAGVQFAYVPNAALNADSLPWPPITQLSGELVFERAAMSIKSATGRLGNVVQITKADALIPNLGSASATVAVSADARSPLSNMLGLVSGSPLSTITGKALSQAKGTGNADLKLRLNLPINNIDRSKVTGTLTLANNDVQITPDTPLLTRTSGLVTFNETGFTLKDVASNMLGGDVRLTGGSRPIQGPSDATIALRAQGTISAEGLRQAKELGLLARLGKNMAGSTAYAATLNFRAGVPELAVTTNLQGMALSLPAPLGKTAESIFNVRYDNSLVPASMAADQKLQDLIQVDLGTVAQIAYVRDVSGKTPKVLRGSIGVGLLQGESVPKVDDGVVANINLAQINVDTWRKLLGNFSTDGSGAAPALPVAPIASAAGSASAQALTSYLPSVVAVRAKELILEGRTLNNVVVGGSREGLTWRANLDAGEISGYMEYRQASAASAGLVYARLARLNLAQAAAAELESALDNQPTAIPALDIVVEDFQLRGKKFGRIEIEAVNRGTLGTPTEGAVREWRLNKFNATMPEAQFSASGNWAAVNQTAQGADTRPARAASERRRTVMNFKLDIANSGELLKRIGMDKVIAKGKGVMEGQVAWLGSPLDLDFATLGGNVNVNIESGQFLKVDPGFGKLIGVLSLQSLPRRLTLDFRDVFTEGFAFDFIRGDAKIDQGVAFTNNLQMKGVNAAVLMEGTAHLTKETQDLRVVVVPEINAGTASLVAAVINPVVGLGSFLAQLILRKPLIEAATQEFHIDGTWADPKITKVKRRSADSVIAGPLPNSSAP